MVDTKVLSATFQYGTKPTPTLMPGGQHGAKPTLVPGGQYGANAKTTPKPIPTPGGQYGSCRACLVPLKKDNSSKRQRGLNRAKRRCTACVPTTSYCAPCGMFRALGDFDQAMLYSPADDRTCVRHTAQDSKAVLPGEPDADADADASKTAKSSPVSKPPVSAFFPGVSASKPIDISYTPPPPRAPKFVPELMTKSSASSTSADAPHVASSSSGSGSSSCSGSGSVAMHPQRAAMIAGAKRGASSALLPSSRRQNPTAHFFLAHMRRTFTENPYEDPYFADPHFTPSVPAPAHDQQKFPLDHSDSSTTRTARPRRRKRSRASSASDSSSSESESSDSDDSESDSESDSDSESSSSDSGRQIGRRASYKHRFRTNVSTSGSTSSSNPKSGCKKETDAKAKSRRRPTRSDASRSRRHRSRRKRSRESESDGGDNDADARKRRRKSRNSSSSSNSRRSSHSAAATAAAEMIGEPVEGYARLVIKWFNVISKRTLLDPLAAHEKDAAENAPAGGGSSSPPLAVAGVPLVCVDGTIVKQEDVMSASSSVGGSEEVAASSSVGGSEEPEDGAVDFEDGEIVDGGADGEGTDTADVLVPTGKCVPLDKLFPLTDPISKARIEVPVRSSRCAHGANFDLTTFLDRFFRVSPGDKKTAAQSVSRFERCSKACPVCGKQISLASLGVDRVCAAILAETDFAAAKPKAAELSLHKQFTAESPVSGEGGVGGEAELQYLALALASLSAHTWVAHRGDVSPTRTASGAGDGMPMETDPAHGMSSRNGSAAGVSSDADTAAILQISPKLEQGASRVGQNDAARTLAASRSLKRKRGRCDGSDAADGAESSVDRGKKPRVKSESSSATPVLPQQLPKPSPTEPPHRRRQPLVNASHHQPLQPPPCSPSHGQPQQPPAPGLAEPPDRPPQQPRHPAPHRPLQPPLDVSSRGHAQQPPGPSLHRPRQPPPADMNPVPQPPSETEEHRSSVSASAPSPLSRTCTSKPHDPRLAPEAHKMSSASAVPHDPRLMPSHPSNGVTNATQSGPTYQSSANSHSPHSSSVSTQPLDPRLHPDAHRASPTHTEAPMSTGSGGKQATGPTRAHGTNRRGSGNDGAHSAEPTRRFDREIIRLVSDLRALEAQCHRDRGTARITAADLATIRRMLEQLATALKNSHRYVVHMEVAAREVERLSDDLLGMLFEVSKGLAGRVLCQWLHSISRFLGRPPEQASMCLSAWMNVHKLLRRFRFAKAASNMSKGAPAAPQAHETKRLHSISRFLGRPPEQASMCLSAWMNVHKLLRRFRFGKAASNMSKGAPAAPQAHEIKRLLTSFPVMGDGKATSGSPPLSLAMLLVKSQAQELLDDVKGASPHSASKAKRPPSSATKRPPSTAPADPRVPKRSKRVSLSPSPPPPKRVETNPEGLADDVPAGVAPRVFAGRRSPPRDPRMFPPERGPRGSPLSPGSAPGGPLFSPGSTRRGSLSLRQRRDDDNMGPRKPAPSPTHVSPSSEHALLLETSASAAAPARQTTRLDRVLDSIPMDLVPLGYKMQGARDALAQRHASTRRMNLASSTERIARPSPPASPVSSSAKLYNSTQRLSPPERPVSSGCGVSAQLTERSLMESGRSARAAKSQRSGKSSSVSVGVQMLAIQSDRPATQSDRPATQSDGPATQSDRPAIQSDRPATQSDRPATRSDGPATQSDRPATQSDRPATQSDRPAAQSDRPATQSDRPHVDGDACGEVIIKQETGGEDSSASMSLDSSLDAASFMFQQLFGSLGGLSPTDTDLPER